MKLACFLRWFAAGSSDQANPPIPRCKSFIPTHLNPEIRAANECVRRAECA